MLQVVPPIKTVQKILGQQKAEERTPYRLSTHCMRVERPEGVLLYHTLTGELLLLSPMEAAELEKLSGSIPSSLGELAARWFLRPQEADDKALADQTRQIAARLMKKRTAITGYTISTTTNCNARCFYCFEAGWGKSSMTEQTARDTARYVAAHCGGGKVQLKWFGGEPLVNVQAIDIITESLREQGVEFRSNMSSNGYLFDEALIQRARDDWNLSRVQITLDGTEEVYNQRKAYVNPQGSPYQRVLRNIGLLLDAGVSVSIRLNMDEDNEQDLYALCDELAERFAGKPGFGVYVTLLWEDTGKCPTSYTEDERQSYAQKLEALKAYMVEKGIMARRLLKRAYSVNACAADSDNYTTVTPEGKLVRCESCRDGSTWGSIYSDKVDEEVLRQWREHRPPEEACETCAAYPQCARTKKCPGSTEHCSPIERARRENNLRRAILCSYEEWRAGQPAQTETV